jgi:hypothetical protein
MQQQHLLDVAPAPRVTGLPFCPSLHQKHPYFEILFRLCSLHIRNAEVGARRRQELAFVKSSSVSPEGKPRVSLAQLFWGAADLTELAEGKSVIGCIAISPAEPALSLSKGTAENVPGCKSWVNLCCTQMPTGDHQSQPNSLGGQRGSTESTVTWVTLRMEITSMLPAQINDHWFGDS